MLAEGAGAAAIAAVVNHKIKLVGKKIAVLVCGGNMDVTLLSRIIERGLVKDGRLVHLRVHLPDYPGALHKVTGILANHRANIVETSYDRAYYGVNLGDTAIDITMETRGPDHIAELLSALEAGGYAHKECSNIISSLLWRRILSVSVSVAVEQVRFLSTLLEYYPHSLRQRSSIPTSTHSISGDMYRSSVSVAGMHVQSWRHQKQQRLASRKLSPRKILEALKFSSRLVPSHA